MERVCPHYNFIYTAETLPSVQKVLLGGTCLNHALSVLTVRPQKVTELYILTSLLPVPNLKLQTFQEALSAHPAATHALRELV